MLDFLKYRSVQTLFVLLIYAICAGFLPDNAHVVLYTVSVFIKDLLIWVMPLTVGFFIAHTVSSFQKKAPLFIIVILLLEGCSNFFCIWYAYGISHGAVLWLPSLRVANISSQLDPLWLLPWHAPVWWNASRGALVGVVAGVLGGLMRRDHVLPYVLLQGKKTVEVVLTQFFARLLPFFILGFAAKMYQTQILGQVMQHYALSTLYLTMGIFIYLCFLIALGVYQRHQTIGSFTRMWMRHFKNLSLPSGIAFSTGCSLSTMPWTIEGTSRNMNDPSLAQAVIPATTNIQQVGDCIMQGFVCATLYHSFYGHLPDMQTWLVFSGVFTIARFATAAILGGAIFIMIPLYEAHLNFTPEMIAILLALNAVLDPLVTSSNVMGNGALCRTFERVWEAIHRVILSWNARYQGAPSQ